jgi:ubiquinone/menaquinone biosynthesis C-methylase UbiE
MTKQIQRSDYSTENSSYLEANPTWHIQDSPWKATQILKMFERNSLKPSTVVEIGCGAGEILNQLHQRLPDKSIEFSGYEIAPDAFKLCLQRQKERLHYYQEDLLQTENKYDLLLMIDVFEHVDDYIGFLKEAAKKAKYKIYHIPMDMSAYGILTNYPIGARKQVGHLHHFMKDTALATLQYTGHEVIDWFYTAGALELNNKGLGFFGTIINMLRKFMYWLKPDLAVKTFGGFSLIVLTK